MYQLFFIFNKSRDSKAAGIPLELNFGLPYITNLNRYTVEQQKAIFMTVLNYNLWDESDTLEAQGDQFSIFYENGKIFTDNSKDKKFDEEEQDELYRTTLATKL